MDIEAVRQMARATQEELYHAYTDGWDVTEGSRGDKHIQGLVSASGVQLDRALSVILWGVYDNLYENEHWLAAKHLAYYLQQANIKRPQEE